MMAATPAFILLGAGGHAKVVLSLLRARGDKVLGVCDPDLVAQGISRWRDLDVLGNDQYVLSRSADEIVLALGIGQLPGSRIRERLFRQFTELGYGFPALVHPSAWVDDSAVLAEGVQVMAGAVIQPDVQIGQNSLINTRVSIDHDCVIEQLVHVAPGAVLCGSVTVQEHAFIGSGATVIQGVTVGAAGVVAAGVTLRKDLAPATTYTGHR